jgi:hypothetical protein
MFSELQEESANYSIRLEDTQHDPNSECLQPQVGSISLILCVCVCVCVCAIKVFNKLPLDVNQF